MRIAAVAAAVLLAPMPAQAQAQAPAAYAYDDILQVGVENAAPVVLGNFAARDAALRAAIDDGSVVSGRALQNRLFDARDHEQIQAVAPPSGGHSLLGGLGPLGGLVSAFLPPPAQALMGVFNGGGIRSLLGALPGVGGGVASQVLNLVPGKSRGPDSQPSAEQTQRVAAGVAREEQMGHLTHMTVFGSSYRKPERVAPRARRRRAAGGAVGRGRLGRADDGRLHVHGNV